MMARPDPPPAIDGSRPGRWRLDRWLTLAGGVIILAVIVAAILLIVNLQNRVTASRSQELRNLALVLSQEIERALEAVQTVETSLIERMQGMGVMSPESFDSLMGSEDAYTMLREKSVGLPYIEALTLIDKDGRLRNFSRYFPTPDVNVSDRDYFRALVEDSDRTTYLSAPVLNRGSGTWTVYLAHKFTEPNGKLLGMVLGAMRLDYIEKFYSAVKVGTGGAISLIREDGILLVRYPRAESKIGLPVGTLDGRPGLQRLKNEQAVRHMSPIDGLDRLTAAQLLTHYPVLVTVSATMQSIAAGWRTEMNVIISGATLLCAIIGICVALGRRQILAQYRLAEAASQMARHDALTGLPNRVLFREKLKEYLDTPSAAAEPAAILLVDLDYFKTVNDTLGHPAGDSLLRVIAERLRRCIRPRDLVARLGGDEFAIIQSHAATALSTQALAQRIVDAVGVPCQLGEDQVIASASVGITFTPEQGIDGDQLLKNADLALYRAKADGRGKWRVFTLDMAEQVQARRAAELALRGALQNDGFSLHYQPVVSLETGTLVGMEALLRWKGSTNASAAPAGLIAAAEETGLIVPLGRWVLQTACEQAMTWPGSLRVAVNVSTTQLRSVEFLDHVIQCLAHSGLPASRLELEITETVFLPENVQEWDKLAELRDLGVSIALDDFGTGYSSLSYLRRFPVDRVKIDISFVRDICKNEESARIVRAIVDLAQSLGMSSTAEGVESQDQLRLLAQCGCEEVQGYYTGRPTAPDGLGKIFRLHGLPVLEGGASLEPGGPALVTV